MGEVKVIGAAGILAALRVLCEGIHWRYRMWVFIAALRVVE